MASQGHEHDAVLPQALVTLPQASVLHDTGLQMQELLEQDSSAPQEPHAMVRCVPQRSLTVIEPQVALFATQSS